MNDMRRISDYLLFDGKLLGLILLIGVIFSFLSHTESRAQIGIFDFCSCEDSEANVIECNDDAVAVRCDITDNSWLPFEMSTLRIDTNNLLKDNGSSKEIGFFSSPVIVEAWGGQGGTGSSKAGFTCNGGSKGERGYARTAVDYSLFTRTGVYIYLGKKGDSGTNGTNKGGKGGASTIVIGQRLESVEDPCDFDFGCTPENQRVYLMAGGGGGGGGCSNSCNINGRDGGRGACAVSVSGDSGGIDVPNSNCAIGTFGESVSATGNDGSNQDSTGKGGNPDLQGSGAECRGTENSRNGKSGLGGRGGARNKDGNNYETWENSLNPDGSSEKIDIDWIQGEGGTGDSSKAGAGGGGYGGACGGNTDSRKCGSGPGAASFGQGGGGGGGGTFSLGATVSEEGFNLSVNELGSVNNGQVGLLIGLLDKDESKFGEALHVAEDAFGEARELGSGVENGSIELTAAFNLEGRNINLNQAEITIGTGFLEQDGEIVPSISGMQLSSSQQTASASNTSSRVIFESPSNSPDVTVDLENTDGELKMNLNARNVEILESSTCADAEDTGIEFYLTVDDGVNEPLLLEVLGHWDCMSNDEGLVDLIILSAEESTRDETSGGTGGGNCSLSDSSQSPSTLLILILLPLLAVLLMRFYRAVDKGN